MMDYQTFLNERADPETRSASTDHSAVVCLATKGTPVIYVSDAFEAHTGYSAQDAIGRSLSFLQGPETEPEAVAAFRKLIATGSAGLIRITNYRKDGTVFSHECAFRPISDSEGTVTHFVAIQKLVAD